ncbi:MAG: beta-lactamase family protein [Clostridia bacterium]|nr:beta-lactamase family protein [Clostridia bacterium]
MRSITPEAAGISSTAVLDFLKALEAYQFNTHSILMARGDGIFAECYYAPFTADRLHRMYSISKSFTGIAIGLCIEDGLLSLDDKLADFFPEYDAADPWIAGTTIRGALTMRTCMSSYTQWRGMPHRADAWFATKPSHPSGMEFWYDSSASYLLGVIVKRLTGKDFFTFLRERVLDKIGFSADSHVMHVTDGNAHADSGVMCTPRDLLKFARFVMNSGVWKGERLMNGDYLAAATSRQTDNSDGNVLNYNNHGYGYQIWKTPDDGFAFYGMGDQFAICDRAHDFIFVITSDNQGSSGSRPILFELLYSRIIRCLGKPLPDNPAAQTALADYIAGAKLNAARGTACSPIADSVNGVDWRCGKNPMGIERFRLDFDGDGGSITYTNRTGTHTLRFGFGYNICQPFPDSGDSGVREAAARLTLDSAVSAAWVDDRKLRIKVQIIDRDLGNLAMDISFRENNALLHMTKNAVCFLDAYGGTAVAERV